MNTLKHIVLTTDFSECARAALPLALTLAKTYQSTLYVAHVIAAPIPYPVFYYGAVAPTQPQAPVNEPSVELKARAVVELRKWIGDAAQGVEIKPVILDGIPILELLKYLESSKADLVVTATHGYGFFKRALLGSVANQLVHEAACPVLTVRADEGK